MISKNNSHEVYGYEINPNDDLGFLARKLDSDKNLSTRQKAEIIYALKEEKEKSDLFPYNRYIKYASNNNGIILDNTKTQKKANNKCIVWNTNHYLGMNRHPEVIAFAKECLDKYGAGSGTSVFAGGMNELHKKIEAFICNILDKEESILFPTGFTANSGALSVLPSKNDCVLFDNECHSSIINGIKLSGVKITPFKHNDLDDLEKKIIRYGKDRKNIWVVLESIYSMSGDESPIKEICLLKDKYCFYLFVDEAHSFGIYGENGKGLCAHHNCLTNIDVIMTTLSKSVGVVGGILACSKELATLIKVKSDPYIFQACMPPGDAAAVYKSLKIIYSDKKYRELLWDNVKKFRKSLKDIGFKININSTSPIVCIYIKDPTLLIRIGNELFANGLFFSTVSYPVVKKDEGRLRFIVSAYHTKKDILTTVNVLKSIFTKYKTQVQK
jgi:7-keto-8-aminopelargonate synthetase-like enzyme